LFTIIDAQPLRGELLSFHGLAERHGVSIQKVHNINCDETENQIRDFAPDIIVSARFSLIFKANILSIPRWGTYNIHPGALPGYAGLFAPMRALLNGDTRLGCTLHQVDEGIDSGPIHSVSWLAAIPTWSVFDHISDVYRLGLQNMMLLLDDLARGLSPRLEQQDPAAFRYYCLPNADDFALLRQRGIEPVNLPDYCRFIRRFWPSGLTRAEPTFFDPAALARQISVV
jgi:methionyl-tRNA formyltransferase